MRSRPAPPPPDDRNAAGREPAFNVPPATLWLAAGLIVVFAALRLMPENLAAALVDRLSFSGAVLLNALAGHAPLAEGLLRTVSYTFLHIDGLHLAVNVGFLVAFGSPVERRLGAPAFLLLFLAASIVGALFETFFFVDDAMLQLPAIGASGGIFGLMGAALMIATARPRLDPRLASELDPAAVALVEARMAQRAWPADPHRRRADGAQPGDRPVERARLRRRVPDRLARPLGRLPRRPRRRLAGAPARRAGVKALTRSLRFAPVAPSPTSWARVERRASFTSPGTGRGRRS